MDGKEVSQITRLVRQVDEGHQEAAEELARVLHAELRPMAAGLLRRMFDRAPADGTDTPTAIVDAAWMRIIRQRQRYDNRRHFFAIASLQVRRVVVDYWRQWKARGGPKQRLQTDFGELATDPADEGPNCEDLFAALEKLEALDSLEADVVRMRFLWGLTIAETASSLGVSHATVERRWQHARAWLRRELGGDRG